MNQQSWWTRGRMGLGGLAAIAALATGATEVRAGIKESQNCRKEIASQYRKIAELGLKLADGCHKGKDKLCTAGTNRGACNAIGTLDFDPKLKFPASVDKAAAKVDAKCLPGDPVLTNYYADPNALLLDDAGASGGIIGQATSGNSGVVLGDDDLCKDTQPAEVKCHAAIRKQRSNIIKEVVKDSIKCQQALDKAKTVDTQLVGTLDPSCLDSGDKNVPKALETLDPMSEKTKCPNPPLVDGNSIGSCTPFPNCVTDAAVQTGQQIAQQIYTVAPPVCGDGVVAGSEQCDDGNLVAGDGCDGSCNAEGGFTCSPVGGTRTVTVAINASTALGGLQIDMDYPQFEAGIPGKGTSSVVQTRLSVAQPGGLVLMNDRDTDLSVGLVSPVTGYTTGNLFTLTFDSCAALSLNICNRAQNVTGCCPGGLAGCEFSPPVCTSFPPVTTVGPGTPAGCCPGDNQCVSQTAIHGCSVIDPVDQLGQPVAGVTCSVTVTEP